MTPYLIIAAASLFLFYRALKCNYVVDDEIRVRDMGWHKESLKTGKITKLKFLWESLYGAGFFGNVKHEYLFTVSLHLVNSMLIYRMSGSLLASVLYLLNPVNNQTAIWLNGRRYAISVLCVLLAWNFKFLFAILYPCAMWVHVSAAAAPLLLLFTPFWFMIPVLAGGGVILGGKRIKAFAQARKEAFTADNELQKLTWRKSILYVKSIGFYFFHCLLPVKPKMYHEFLYYFSRYKNAIEEGYSLNLDFWKGAGALSFLLYEIVFHQNFYAFWFLAFISQWCNIYTVTMNAADRYCSLANAGLMVLLAHYIGKLPEPYGMIPVCVLLTAYVMIYHRLFGAYKDYESFHQYHIGIQPDGVESRAIMANRYLTMRDPYRAFAIIKDGLKHRPHDFKLLLSMSQIMFQMRKTDAGLKVLAIAEKYIPLGEEENCRDEFKKIRNHIVTESLKSEGIEVDNIEKEVTDIFSKKSTLPSKIRDRLSSAYLKVHAGKNGN